MIANFVFNNNTLKLFISAFRLIYVSFNLFIHLLSLEYENNFHLNVR